MNLKNFFFLFSIIFKIITFIFVLISFEEVEAFNLTGCCSRDEIFDNNSTGKGAFCIYKNNKSYDNDDNDVKLKNFTPNCKGVLAIVDSDINSSLIEYNFDGKIEINSDYYYSNKRINNDDIDDKEEVCLDIEGSQGKLVLRTCKDIEYCNVNPCLRKCCPENEIYMDIPPVCRKTDDTTIQTLAQWHIKFRDVQINLTNEEGINRAMRNGYNDTFDSSDYGILFGRPPECHYGRRPALITDDRWHLDSKGISHYGPNEYYNHTNSCIEIWLNGNVTTFQRFPCWLTGEEEKSVEDFCRITKFTLMMISCSFLLVTLFVYGYLTALQNLHGKTVMAYVGSLLFGYIGLALIMLNFIRDYQGKKPDKELYYDPVILCNFLGYSTLFFLLSVFAWLNVISYDIWDKFRSLRNSGRSLSDRREAKIRFIYYCIFAWGYGLILTILAFLSDRYEYLPDYLLPHFGKQRCWFTALDSERKKSYSEILFFFGPVFVQLLINVILYVLTARRCSLVKNEIANRVKADRSNNTDKTRDFESDRTKIILSVKLFVVMGILWIFEMATFITNFFAPYPTPDWIQLLFLLPDAVNCLQGLYIFLLFVYKDQVLQALKRKFFRSGSSLSSSSRTSTNLRRLTVNDPFNKSRRSKNVTTMTTSNGGLYSDSSF